MYRVIIFTAVFVSAYIQGHYCIALYIIKECTRSLLYCSVCQCGFYNIIIVLREVLVRCLQYHCTAYCVTNVCTRVFLYCSISVRYIQWHYYTTVCVSAVYTVSLLSRSVSLLCVQCHICTALSVSAVCTGALLYCHKISCSFIALNLVTL